ncbi:orotate phosphoribosyltransferase [Sandaracinus amylolyticus]|uniref:orotate phosphoribosyltransferase n=1 Tax=Sandaracinus amylolyticus TaxID=927083 RepID=UPI001F0B61DC|nr:orotate phosphoribosyltransferase [Sandaracinus amylolyticus]
MTAKHLAPTGTRERLLELLRTRCFARKKVVLASGRESDFFIDCKQAVLLAEGHVLIGELMLEAALALPTHPVAVAGVELGGCPLASAVALVSFQRDVRTERGVGLDAIYVRKQAKDHGSQRQLEGDVGMQPNDPVVVVEDVVTTGGSTLRAIERLRERGLTVAGVVAIVDRLEGGAENVRAAGVHLTSLFTRHDFIPA